MIGIFGGAFDPPHKEHIAIAHGIVREYALEKVIFLPSGNSPHKTLETPFSIRAEMLGAAIGGEDFELDRLEETFPERAYSYRILPLLKEKYGEILFVIGGDSLLHLDSWRLPGEILKICPLLVVPRGDDALDILERKAAEFTSRYGGRILISKQVRGESVSSTEIRAKVALGLATPEIAPEVAALIERYDLYQEKRAMIDRVRSMLTEKRWRHTCGVVLAGLKINERVGLPIEKVFISCLLHDCMKYAEKVHEGVPTDAIGSKVLHAFNGAEEAKIGFGITDPEIVDAIRYHTTGRAGMTPLDKLVYTADMVEELTRDFEGVEELRACAYENLDEGFKRCFLICYEHLLESGKPIYPLTIDCYDDYIKGV